MFYLRTGTLNTTAGILFIILFNWLSLVGFEKGNYRWKIWHYFTGAWSLYFAGFLGYGLFGIINASVEFNFITSENLTYVISTILFCAMVILHTIWYFRASKNQRE